MWLGHRVTDAVNGETARSGTPKNDTWDLAEPAAQKWEVQLSEDNLTHSFHLATVDKVLKDNRIPPKGFRPQLSTAPVGQQFEVQPDGTLAHWDDVALPLGDSGCWPLVVEATLYFQTLSGDYYRFLLDNAPLNGPALQASWEATGGAVPVQMQHVEVTVYPDGRIVNGRVPGACEPAPVYEEPQPEAPAPEVTPEPTPEPVEPDATPETPRVQDPFQCRCAQTTSPAGPAFAGMGIAALVLLSLRRRRARFSSGPRRHRSERPGAETRR